MKTQMPTPNESLNPSMLAALKEMVDETGRLDFETYVQTVLYAPEIGYYARESPRVGRLPEADFYTAQSLGPIFGRLVVKSCENLTGKETLGKYTFVEIGAEPGRSVLQGVAHSFGDVQTIRVGHEIVIPENAIVFANEWLDAQPFRRFRFDQEKGWIERGVGITDDGSIREVDLPESCLDALPYPEKLPSQTQHDYLLDLPTGADKALQDLCSQPWSGLFLTLDYGLTLVQFLEERPEGVARAYRRHRLSKDLLAHPGNQDITCHVCWDNLRNILHENGFRDIFLERQEAFFLRRASPVAEAIATAKPGTFDTDRQTLLEILHPGNMGSKFQALCGVRKKRPRQTGR